MIEFILNNGREILLIFLYIGFLISCIGAGVSLGKILSYLLYGGEDDE